MEEMCGRIGFSHSSKLTYRHKLEKNTYIYLKSVVQKISEMYINNSYDETFY